MVKKPATKPLPVPEYIAPWYEKPKLLWRCGIGAIVGSVFLIAPVFHIAESWANWWLSSSNLNIICPGLGTWSPPSSDNAGLPAFIATIIVCGGLFVWGCAAIVKALED